MTTFAYIIKRNGQKVVFESQRIYIAIEKAFFSENISEGHTLLRLTDQVVSTAKAQFPDQDTIKVEAIQDIVEEILMNNGPVVAHPRYSSLTR